MTVQKRHIAIFLLTAFITSLLIGSGITLADFEVENKCLTVAIPDDLLYELTSGEENIVIAQHGFKHTYNVSDEEKVSGYELLKLQGVDAEYYIAPYEHDNSHPFLPVLYRKEFFEERSAEMPWEYSEAGLDNLGRRVVIIHIQDTLYSEVFATSGYFDCSDVIRVDDVNTDIVPSDVQARRVRLLREYTTANNKTLILGVIPYVERLPWFYPVASFFLKFLFIAWLLLILPYYVFYILSWRLL